MDDIRDTVGSVGLIILDPIKKHILCVRSRNTYPGGCLVSGRKWYSPINLDDHFVNGMSLLEKRAFLGDDAKSGYPYFLSSFRKCYSRKLASMSRNGAKYFTKHSLDDYIESLDLLRNKMSTSMSDGALPWGFPKGRIISGDNRTYRTIKELEVAVALRETHEETKISIDMIDILDWIPPFVIRYVDMGIRYEFKLYYAIPKTSCRFYLDEADVDQIHEISAIEWLTYEMLADKPLCDITRKHILGNFCSILEHHQRHVSDQLIAQSLHNSLIDRTIDTTNDDVSEKKQTSWTPRIYYVPPVMRSSYNARILNYPNVLSTANPK